MVGTVVRTAWISAMITVACRWDVLALSCMLVYIVRPVYFIGDLLIALLCVDMLRHCAHVLQ